MTYLWAFLVGVVAGFLFSGYLDTREELRQRTAYDNLLNQAYERQCP